MSTLRVNNITDTSGGSSSLSVPGAAKAWVNFNGTGTVAIRASMNVSSITDNGTGDYSANFTNALTDTNYVVAMQNPGGQTGTTWPFYLNLITNSATTPTLKTTSAVRFGAFNPYNQNPGGYDAADIGVAIFR